MNANATQFADLNALLVELAVRARDILKDNFVGAYLQGSFAVGDADLASDCDFLIPVHGPVSAEQEAALRSLHREIPSRADHWAKHLEGSYPHLDELRTLAGMGRSGSTSITAGAKCNGPHIATPRWFDGRCASVA